MVFMALPDVAPVPVYPSMLQVASGLPSAPQNATASAKTVGVCQLSVENEGESDKGRLARVSSLNPLTYFMGFLTPQMQQAIKGSESLKVYGSHVFVRCSRKTSLLRSPPCANRSIRRLNVISIFSLNQSLPRTAPVSVAVRIV